jgi:hypothetical protein
MKKFWSYIKSQRNEKSGISDLLDNHSWITDPPKKGDLFNAQLLKFSQHPVPLLINSLKMDYVHFGTMRYNPAPKYFCI